MPEKDGDEDKSTKSVVKKKQKQMMGEEQFSDKQRSDMKDILNKNFGSEDKSKETAGKLIKDKAKKDVEKVQSGKQPNKSTPSTKLGRSSVNLNKYFGEEGYDHLRDQGRIRKTKDKKDATTLPVSDEVKKTRKVNKGPSALDIVKKKYKGQIMKMEELDLTKVAEAFGGHIVEQTTDDEKKTEQEKPLKDRVNKGTGSRKLSVGKYTYTSGQRDQIKKGEEVLKKIKSFKKGETTGTEKPKRGSKTMSGQRNIFTGKPEEIKVKTTYDKQEKPAAASPQIPDETPLFTSDLEPKKFPKPRKPRTIPFKDRKQLDTETQKKVDAVTPPFATKQGETGPLPVSMRNRRVPKTSSLSPNVKVTSIVKPTVGSLPLTQTDFNKIVPFRRPTKKYNDVINPEIVDPGGRQQEKGGDLGVDTGPTVIGQVIKDKPTKTDIKKLKPPKIAGYIAPEIKKPEKTDEPIADPIGGGKGGGKKTKVGNFSYRPGGAFSKIRGFARRNPALSLVGYDALKNLQVPRVEKPTKTGRVSAGS